MFFAARQCQPLNDGSSVQRLAEERSLLLDELQVMLPMLGVVCHQIAKCHLAALAVNSGAVPGLLWQTAQQIGGQ